MLELLPRQTWDSVTSQLRSYDRAESHLRKESVHVASSSLICNFCHAVGYKSPDCPQNRGGGKGGGGKGGGRNSGRGYIGGKGG